MKHYLLTILAIVGIAAFHADACTNLIAGKNATTDGSTLITYAADSHQLFGELYYLPAADHPKGAMREIREWDTDKVLGSIPEVAHTYAVVGNMNEHQLTIAESTYGGRHELLDTTGQAIMDYGSLIYVTLQRARTAREAISIMTDLIDKYGYASEGESFSIGDPNEVWIMEVIGKGAEKGAVWVAIRVPDDCIAAHANQSRIYRFPLNDKNNCLYSKDVISFARKRGYFSGKDADFEFATAYCPLDFGALRGCDARVWAYFNRFCSGMDRYLPYINGKKGAELMPLCVRPDRKLSVRDLQSMMRDHFEGTPFDMTKDHGAKVWYGVPYRYRPMDYEVDGEHYCMERAIATQQTGWVFVAQMRSSLPDPVGGCLWFGVDDANTAVFLPMYCCINRIPDSYQAGKWDLYTLDWNSAFWVNNWVANQAYNRYSLMIGDIRTVQNDIEDSIAAVTPDIEQRAAALCRAGNEAQAVKLLTDYACDNAARATAKYRKLGEYLFVKYLDGNIKREKDGKFQRTETGIPASPIFGGYSEEYYRDLVKHNGDLHKVHDIEK